MVVGGGGREHAICDCLRRSPRLNKLYCAPGNAGISAIAECVPAGAMEFDKIVGFAKERRIDIVFVAPDDPLYGGLVDLLEDNGIRAFGPRKNAAIIEGSKSFSKEFMARHGIPTAEYRVFTDYGEAAAYALSCPLPAVVKADGLALGKGVVIAETREQASAAVKEMMLDKVFGSAGNSVIFEEFLTGREFTLLAFCDGTRFSAMPACQDHKKAYDGDKGPNTGGMGAFCPTKVYDGKVKEETLERIVKPTIAGLYEEGREFKGVIYFGLMETVSGVKVIEYNARFGDPETQAVLPLLKTDFIDVIEAVIDGSLDEVKPEWERKCGFCVVAASGGYPGKIVKGLPIEIGDMKDVKVFHAGTAFDSEGRLVTAGGRVLCVTATGESVDECRRTVYGEIDKIRFDGIRYRKDIGIK